MGGSSWGTPSTCTIRWVATLLTASPDPGPWESAVGTICGFALLFIFSFTINICALHTSLSGPRKPGKTVKFPQVSGSLLAQSSPWTTPSEAAGAGGEDSAPVHLPLGRQRSEPCMRNTSPDFQGNRGWDVSVPSDPPCLLI